MAEQSVDAPEYEQLDLLNYGAEPDLVDASVAYAQAALPEWEPRAGNTEMVLMESLAMMLGIEVLALQMAPTQVLEQLMGLYGVERDPGNGAESRVRFTVTASDPIQTIPAGTRLRVELETTQETFDFLTTENLEIMTSESVTGVTEIGAELVGAELNGMPAGTEIELVDNLWFVEDVELLDPFGLGADEESDDSYYSRAASVLSRLTSTLVLPEHFTYAATSTPGIYRARTLDLYDPAHPEAESVGHVTVAVADAAGEPVEEPLRARLNETLEQQALASLQIHVIDPTYTTVDMAVSVRPSPGYTDDQVKEAVTAALQEWINPANWDWEPEVGQYAAVAVIGATAGVASIVDVTPTVALPGDAPLPRLGTVTVTVK